MDQRFVNTEKLLRSIWTKPNHQTFANARYWQASFISLTMDYTWVSYNCILFVTSILVLDAINHLELHRSKEMVFIVNIWEHISILMYNKILHTQFI